MTELEKLQRSISQFREVALEAFADRDKYRMTLLRANIMLESGETYNRVQDVIREGLSIAPVHNLKDHVAKAFGFEVRT